MSISELEFEPEAFVLHSYSKISKFISVSVFDLQCSKNVLFEFDSTHIQSVFILKKEDEQAGLAVLWATADRARGVWAALYAESRFKWAPASL